VKRNVAAFGGDPDQVTIVGESAGGISVVHLLTWPAARGLFHRAAVLSGGGRSYLVQHRKLSEATRPRSDRRPLLPSAEDAGLAFADSMGITDRGPAGLAALRALPADRVNGDLSMEALLTRPSTYAGGPVNDGDVVTSEPEAKIRKGDLAPVPLVIGTTGTDLPGTYPPDRTRLFDFFGPDADRARQLYDPARKLPADKGSLADRNRPHHARAGTFFRPADDGCRPVGRLDLSLRLRH
jgi:para-nitrobenzyl esterase